MVHIVNDYQQSLNNQGVEKAELITAISLSEEDKQKLAEHLSAISGKRIMFTKSEVDPSIIAGIKVKIGDKLIDGSIKSRLVALQEELTVDT